MEFRDKNGEIVDIGDIVRPDDGRDCLIISKAKNNELNEVVLYGQQLLDPAAFAVLTKDILSTMFTKINTEYGGNQ